MSGRNLISAQAKRIAELEALVELFKKRDVLAQMYVDLTEHSKKQTERVAELEATLQSVSEMWRHQVAKNSEQTERVSQLELQKSQWDDACRGHIQRRSEVLAENARLTERASITEKCLFQMQEAAKDLAAKNAALERTIDETCAILRSEFGETKFRVNFKALAELEEARQDSSLNGGSEKRTTRDDQADAPSGGMHRDDRDIEGRTPSSPPLSTTQQEATPCTVCGIVRYHHTLSNHSFSVQPKQAVQGDSKDE